MKWSLRQNPAQCMSGVPSSRASKRWKLYHSPNVDVGRNGLSLGSGIQQDDLIKSVVHSFMFIIYINRNWAWSSKHGAASKCWVRSVFVFESASAHQSSNSDSDLVFDISLHQIDHPRRHQEQTCSEFVRNCQVNIQPLVAGLLGGFPISKAYMEATPDSY